jgi:hypothetical protein
MRSISQTFLRSYKLATKADEEFDLVKAGSLQ